MIDLELISTAIVCIGVPFVAFAIVNMITHDCVTMYTELHNYKVRRARRFLAYFYYVHNYLDEWLRYRLSPVYLVLLVAAFMCLRKKYKLYKVTLAVKEL